MRRGTANKTEKREKQLAIGNGGRYAGNEQFAVSNEQWGQRVALPMSN
jgi:hypothetical protein